MRRTRLTARLDWRGAFTLVELMIVVVIVAILAAVAVPIYRGNVEAARMSEGIAGCGTIRTAARVYIAMHSSLPEDVDLAELGIEDDDLDGRYFDVDSYTFTRDAATEYTISAELGDLTYEIDEDGLETSGDGYFTTGQ